MEAENDENETEEFDRDLPPTHSYLPGGLSSIRGRSVLEPGWEGRIPCWCHHSVVFPGESVPMHCPDLGEYRFGLQFIRTRRLFGLIFPDHLRNLSGYGVLCEVIEATEPFEGEDDVRRQISFKAQARQRFRIINRKKWEDVFQSNKFISQCDIKTLPDIVLNDPLQGNRTFSLLQRDSIKPKLRRADAMVTPWPFFVYDLFDLSKIITCIKTYFKELRLENLPSDVLSLSYWVASNLTISIEDHLRLFKIDNALARLFMELKYLKKCKMICDSCILHAMITEICNMEEIIPMSKEGLHSNYCNIGGYVHNVITVKSAANVTLQGRPSLEFTWFPGYYWTIATCSKCHAHLGWKFTATKKSLRPQSFWGLTSNSITTQLLSTPQQ